MYIIADSGSTKCDWVVVEGDNTRHIHTPGINAVMLSPEQIETTLVEGFGAPTRVDAVYFYGAGCGAQFPTTTALLRERLQRFFATDNVEAESDLQAAARALFGSQRGIACILGTGANSCLYEQGRITHNVPSLGYILGDEGSGAVIGRRVVADALKGLTSAALRESLMQENSLSYESIIRSVYREAMPNRFLASLMPFVGRHIDDPDIRRIVTSSFDEFVERNLRQYPTDAPVGFIGGVAYNFREILRRVVEQHGYRVGDIIKSPMEGLLRYHNGE